MSVEDCSEKEFEQYVKDSLMLKALDQVGVDNWEGYDEALDIYEELLEEYEASKV